MAGEVRPHPRAVIPDASLAAAAIRPLLTKATACEYLAVSERTLDRIVRDGELTAYRVRGQLRFRFDDIETYLAAQRVAR